MFYSTKQIHVYGCNVSILWSPVKNMMAKNLTGTVFVNPVSRPWLTMSVNSVIVVMLLTFQ